MWPYFLPVSYILFKHIDSKGIYSKFSKKSDKDIDRQHQIYLTTVLYNYFILYMKSQISENTACKKISKAI